MDCNDCVCICNTKRFIFLQHLVLAITVHENDDVLSSGAREKITPIRERGKGVSVHLIGAIGGLRRQVLKQTEK